MTDLPADVELRLPLPTYLAGLSAWGAAPGLDLLRWIDNVAARDWVAAYRRAVPQSQMIDSLEYRSGCFLFDWDFRVGDDRSGRVIAAYARSRVHLSVPEAFAELARVVRADEPREAAVQGVKAAILDARDANERLAVRHRAAVLRAILLGEPPVATLVRAIADDRAGALAVPVVVTQISAVERALREALPHAVVPMVTLAPGAKVSPSDLQPLLALGALADAHLDGAGRARLRSLLVSHLRKPDDLLFQELNRCTVERAEAIGGVVGEVFPARGRRPRWGHAQAHYRVLEHADAHPFPVDIGHFLSHASGGPPNINFFLQERALNRGWSPAGRLFRAMERHAAQPGTVYFVRPFHDGPSAVPAWLEYGIFLDERRAAAVEATFGRPLLRSDPGGPALWHEVFRNAPTLRPGGHNPTP